MDAVDYEKKANEALFRSNVYAFLAAVYEKEITRDFLKGMSALDLSELEIDLPTNDNERDINKLLKELSQEYTRLFLGPGRHISPHESIHHEEGGLLWGKMTAKVKNFVEAAGFAYQEDYRGIPDHISAELEFMRQLALLEEQAWKTGNMESADARRKIERQFIDEHLSRWIPAFCDQIIKKTRLTFYSNLAVLTKDFIESERHTLSAYSEC